MEFSGSYLWKPVYLALFNISFWKIVLKPYFATSNFINLFILFIYLWLHWVFVVARGLSLVAASRGYSLLWCACFSPWWLLLFQSTGSRRVGFSSCGSWASERVLRSMWDLPRPGLKPVSPALAGGFLTTVPPGKPLQVIWNVLVL